MKVEMKATITVVMEFPTEKAADAWAAMADVEDLLREGGEAEEGVQCVYLEDEDEEPQKAPYERRWGNRV